MKEQLSGQLPDTGVNSTEKFGQDGALVKGPPSATDQKTSEEETCID
jgi:hypothetical protein